MLNQFDDIVIGNDGLSRPVDRRTAYARALLKVLDRPDGTETLDWQLADAAMAVADIELTQQEKK